MLLSPAFGDAITKLLMIAIFFDIFHCQEITASKSTVAQNAPNEEDGRIKRSLKKSRYQPGPETDLGKKEPEEFVPYTYVIEVVHTFNDETQKSPEEFSRTTVESNPPIKNPKRDTKPTGDGDPGQSASGHVPQVTSYDKPRLISEDVKKKVEVFIEEGHDRSAYDHKEYDKSSKKWKEFDSFDHRNSQREVDIEKGILPKEEEHSRNKVETDFAETSLAGNVDVPSAPNPEPQDGRYKGHSRLPVESNNIQEILEDQKLIPYSYVQHTQTPSMIILDEEQENGNYEGSSPADSFLGAPLHPGGNQQTPNILRNVNSIKSMAEHFSPSERYSELETDSRTSSKGPKLNHINFTNRNGPLVYTKNRIQQMPSRGRNVINMPTRHRHRINISKNQKPRTASNVISGLDYTVPDSKNYRAFDQSNGIRSAPSYMVNYGKIPYHRNSAHLPNRNANFNFYSAPTKMAKKETSPDSKPSNQFHYPNYRHPANFIPKRNYRHRSTPSIGHIISEYWRLNSPRKIPPKRKVPQRIHSKNKKNYQNKNGFVPNYPQMYPSNYILNERPLYLQGSYEKNPYINNVGANTNNYNNLLYNIQPRQNINEPKSNQEDEYYATHKLSPVQTNHNRGYFKASKQSQNQKYPIHSNNHQRIVDERTKISKKNKEQPGDIFPAPFAHHPKYKTQNTINIPTVKNHEMDANRGENKLQKSYNSNNEDTRHEVEERRKNGGGRNQKRDEQKKKEEMGSVGENKGFNMELLNRKPCWSEEPLTSEIKFSNFQPTSGPPKWYTDENTTPGPLKGQVDVLREQFYEPLLKEALCL